MPVETKCKACGRKLVFAMGPNGKYIPLTPVANAYLVAGEEAVPIKAQGGQLYISHYVDCPQAEKFRKRDRTGEPGHESAGAVDEASS